MNKLVATTLESKIHAFDLRTYHPERHYASVCELAQKSTIWGVSHYPQNRDLFVTLGGNGTLNLYKYKYPIQRSLKDDDGSEYGVAGSLELLNDKKLAEQPIISCDWHEEKFGLGVMASLDQKV